MKNFKKSLLQLRNNGRKSRTFSRNISHHGNMILQTENSGTTFIYKNIELLFPRNCSKKHVFDQPSQERGKGHMY